MVHTYFLTPLGKVIWSLKQAGAPVRFLLVGKVRWTVCWAVAYVISVGEVLAVLSTPLK